MQIDRNSVMVEQFFQLEIHHSNCKVFRFLKGAYYSKKAHEKNSMKKLCKYVVSVLTIIICRIK